MRVTYLLSDHVMGIRRLLVCCLLAGCAQFPALEDVEGPGVADADYPRLLSVSELRSTPASTATIELQSSVLDRIAALRARAARLQRSPVVDRPTRARMARGVR